ncbi:MAG: hypothetical protein WCA14_03710 [Steroidobacteraceae bacterium]
MATITVYLLMQWCTIGLTNQLCLLPKGDQSTVTISDVYPTSKACEDAADVLRAGAPGIPGTDYIFHWDCRAKELKQ